MSIYVIITPRNEAIYTLHHDKVQGCGAGA